MNVEAELIGCRVNYHEEVDGVPVYPTVGDSWIETSDDFHLPANLIEIGRMPAITAAMKTIKQKAGRRAALGAFIPGPFTLAGQVLDPDRMFVSVLKKPDSIRDVLAKLAELIARVRRVYGGSLYVKPNSAFTIAALSTCSALMPRAPLRFLTPLFAQRS
jgi:[methyl-Co(III) methanol-specific corrinoid protein]:coenzyme M methyltransferase